MQTLRFFQDYVTENQHVDIVALINSPVQFLPSPVNPSIHVHVTLPSVMLQVA